MSTYLSLGMIGENSDHLAHFPVSLASMQVTWAGSPLTLRSRLPKNWLDMLHLGREESGLLDLGQALPRIVGHSFVFCFLFSQFLNFLVKA